MFKSNTPNSMLLPFPKHSSPGPAFYNINLDNYNIKNNSTVNFISDKND